jgi:hypothetical protein
VLIISSLPKLDPAVEANYLKTTGGVTTLNTDVSRSVSRNIKLRAVYDPVEARKEQQKVSRFSTSAKYMMRTP